MRNQLSSLYNAFAEGSSVLDSRRFHRQRTALGPTKSNQTLCFCSNDYLGLASHPKVIAAMQEAAMLYGVGSTSSALVVGYKKIHQQFEEEFADFVGMEQALLFSSGYLANQGAITALIGRGDFVYQDKENHASLIDAVILSRAKSFRYINVEALQKKLLSHKENLSPEVNADIDGFNKAKDIGDECIDFTEDNLTNVTLDNNKRIKLIVTDSVFSMSGREANITQLLAIAKANNTWLFIDDAHGIGLTGYAAFGKSDGRGVASVLQNKVIKDKIDLNQVVLSAPLGKAFGSSGGVIAGSQDYIEHCIQQARSYIYTTGVAPALAAASLASLQLIKQENWRREKLAKLITQFRMGAEALGLPLLPSQTPIQSLMVAEEEQAIAISELLLQQNILLKPIRYPTVPLGSARLRITLTALHTAQDVDYLLDKIYKCMQQSMQASR